MNALSRRIADLALHWITGPRPAPERVVNPARFGIRLADSVCLERCEGILTAFFSGFEHGLKSPRDIAAGHAATEALLRPFFHEGFAMGCLPHGYLELTGARNSLARLEETFTDEDPYVFLRYVGVGFWLGFQHPRTAGRMDAIAAGLRAAKYRHLVHDGYGFKLGFFGHGSLAFADSIVVARLRRLEGFARESAMNGLGRSLWFFCMDRPAAGFVLARALGGDRDAVIGGMGLAAAFTFTDDLSRAYGAAERLLPPERRHFMKGIRVALYVRASADAGYLRELLERQPPLLREQVESDLEIALKVGAETRHKGDFIEAFHKGCLRP